MTNSKKVDDESLSVKEVLVKDDFEKQKTNNDDISHSKDKSKIQTKMTNKQDSKKCVYKLHSAKIIKEADVSKQRVTRNKSKTLNKNQCLVESSKECDKSNKKNKNSASNKHVLSPNHSITEYFSNLDLKENLKNANEKSDKTVEKLKLNEENLKNKLSHSIVENTKKTLHQGVKKKTDSGSHKLTEYFAIRRSDRKFKKDIDFEKQKDLEKKIINEVEDGLEIKEFDEKGRGIITTKEFNKGDFVIEYIGDLIDRSVAIQRELEYSKNERVGCYMYYFKHKDRQYCIDATKESGKLGRLINHSRKGNLTSRVIEVNKIPHLILFAKADIPIGTEILYDYGDRNQESIKNHPWLTL